jgi:hypothetical protein
MLKHVVSLALCISEEYVIFDVYTVCIYSYMRVSIFHQLIQKKSFLQLTSPLPHQIIEI